MLFSAMKRVICPRAFLAKKLMVFNFPFLKSLKSGVIIVFGIALVSITLKYSLLARLTITSLVVNSLSNDCVTVFFQKDRKSTRLNSSHVKISYAVFCLK